VRDGRWKLLMQGRKPPKLYHLTADLGEITDLAEMHSDRVKQFKAAYNTWLKDVQTGATEQPEKALEQR